MDWIMFRTLFWTVVLGSIAIYFVGWYDLGEPPPLWKIAGAWVLVFIVIGVWGRLRKKGSVR